MSDHLVGAAGGVVRLERYAEAELREILGDGGDPFGVADVGLSWLAKEVHFGVRLDGRLVAHAGLLRLPVVVGGVRGEVVGVGGVAVAADVRGQGLARRVVAAALEHAGTLGPRHGLLFCREALVPLYERLGWRVVGEDVHVEQGDGTVLMPLRTMVISLGEATEWPGGGVRLLSFPM
ncbi:GNAT family N-acetyltransferase (plasmid) [Streptomyces sp. NBC_00536]|uniref:GNAT family N-acetyltransferase n=1 Tax=Streptomyces sp. NBC_00536 TaxID=2975769 RepID=UPI002E8195D5|nr:GNAT family N-acetyltransferase [Streptomyces sp. NBC_00536]WUC84295.1 GNAT family N-acetyltransferase [Streptomyces sp. NBC_00536]